MHTLIAKLLSKVRKPRRCITVKVTVGDLTLLADTIEPHEFYREVEDCIQVAIFAIYGAIKEHCRITPRHLSGTAFPTTVEVSCTVPAHVGAAELHRALKCTLNKYELHITE